MADNRNFAALDWLIHEISETLQEARQSLEDYVDNVEDAARLRSCLSYIHQVHGSLHMMEFFGAAMLADEMERLIQAMLDGRVSNSDEAQEVLMRGILQFPNYLQQIKLTRNDNPGSVLPLLNDLRAVRGENLLTDTKLFVPNLAPAKIIAGTRSPATLDNVQFQAMALKLRQMFQYAAAGFIRSVSTEDNLAYLQKVFIRLHRLTQGTARHALWDICLALAEALETDVLEMSAAVKNLLRQLDKEIKILAVYGIKSLNSYTSEELIKNLLYYVARAGKNTLYFKEDSQLQRVYEAYQLATALIEVNVLGGEPDNMLSAPDSDAMRSVIDALKTELEMVKLALDECITDQYGQQRLADIAPVIKRIADTMAVLGVGPLRRRVLEQGEHLELMANSTSALSQNELLTVASNIIALENELDGLVKTQSPSRHLQSDDAGNREGDITLTRAKEAVLHESRSGLERAKHAIVEYIASQWDRKHLADVPGMLHEIRGGLGIIPLPDAAQIVGACARYIEEQLLAQDLTPQWSKLDSLADAIASVEYYLERLSSGASREENDILLTLAEESIALLGYAVVSVRGAVTANDGAKPSDAYIMHYGNSLVEEHPAAAVVATEQAHLAAAYQSALQVQSIEDASTTAAISEAVANAQAQATNEFGEQVDKEDVFPAGGNHHSTADNSPEVAFSGEFKNIIAESSPSVVPFAQDNDDEIDEEIIEIFVEEAGEVLAAIREFFPRWMQNFEDTKALTEFRRAFHTLKGSGKMVGATDLASLGWSIENMLNRLLDHTIQPSQVHTTIIEKVCEILPAMISAFGQHQANPHPGLTVQYCAMADALARGDMPDELTQLQQFIQDEKNKNLPGGALANALMPQVPISSPMPDQNNTGVADIGDEELWDIFAGEALTHLQVVEEFIVHMDAEAPCYDILSDEVQRALHTLKGSAYMAGVTVIAELIGPLEKFVKELRSYQVVVSDDILQLLRDAVLYIHASLRKIAQRDSVDIPELEPFVARVGELHNMHVESLLHQYSADEASVNNVDPKILSMFMTEELNVLLAADVVLDHWQKNPQDVDGLQPLLNELRQLTRGARLAGLPTLESLSGTIESLYEHILADHLPCAESLCRTLNQSHIALLDMMDTIAAGQNLMSAPAAITTTLQEWIAQGDANAAAGPYLLDHINDDSTPDLLQENILQDILAASYLEKTPEEEDMLAAIAAAEAQFAADCKAEEERFAHENAAVGAVEENLESILYPGESVVEPTRSEIEFRAEAPLHTHVVSRIIHDEEDEFDPEIIEIFIEEALELLEDIERALHNWQEDISDPKPVEELKRYLHTFKGGARLAGLPELGDLSHDFESVFIDMDDHTDINQALFAKLNDYQDLLHKGIAETRIQLDADYAMAAALQERQSGSGGQVATDSGNASIPAVVADHSYPTAIDFSIISQKPNLLTFAPKAKPPAAPLPQIPGSEFGGVRQGNSRAPASVQHLASRRSGPQEVVKVPAELLEELVNLAGETSISRGRMQQQVMDLSGAIGEMDTTILRLQEQLRRLDIETEAQVIFRQEKMAQREDFDPLEMDRYSQLQQLSRSLMESASDLMDLKYTLADKTRDAETLLVQQSRINTDLQEGLMRSRMVPFSRLVPRLRRIVRQAAVELGKDIDFELDNVEGELDRTMLERMVAPLEHMLRNAVDHGIESMAERTAAGKPAMGRISLSLSREGGEVMLRLADDGQGINLQRVREKAIERGLITADTRLKDQDLMQFILHAGFSTVDKVTQISGRGVGMDVVHSEIKQLGGAMFIDSRAGEGTEFIIRLPFTVSVNRALMVQVGDDLYAIPLNTIEGIVRVSPFELEHYYQDKLARFDYAGENYLVRYLGTMLDSGTHPKLEGQTLPLPVILVRSADVTVALQVDHLLGSREIVVKTLGIQFSSVQGLSGATVMGDGSVVVILDLHALIREQLALGIGHSVLLEPYKFQPPAEEEQAEKIIMVVDDSVTVRKVTTRFLEREGYSVITAKDGVEALQLLQDRLPDVMLLDIEMPRMDGFEVAKNIRNSSRLKDLPIIMITSRTGDKHRERALDLGVNKYMGKPYQEDILLANIQELMAMSAP